MTTAEKKRTLRVEYLKPKTDLKRTRLSNECTTSYAAELIGLERRQYELKEKGTYPFHDYEMFVLARYFNKKVSELFF
ncbi:XRE family transcriptional regulator [Brochothrix thermosphacta]|uniref:XRE family transcriptional regulator n=1 Tax=Brochothrix thermosphacta TaxID=2756 RepID=UPI0039AEF8E8